MRRTRVAAALAGLPFGGMHGTVVMATDPTLGVGVLNVPGGPILDIARLSPGFRRIQGRQQGQLQVAQFLASGGTSFSGSTAPERGTP